MSTTLIIYLAIALTFIIVMRATMRRERAKLLRQEYLRRNGLRLQATITEISPIPPSHPINSARPRKIRKVSRYRLQAQATDPHTQEQRTFISPRLRTTILANLTVGDTVTVLLDPNHPSRYMFELADTRH